MNEDSGCWLLCVKKETNKKIQEKKDTLMKYSV